MNGISAVEMGGSGGSREITGISAVEMSRSSGYGEITGIIAVEMGGSGGCREMTGIIAVDIAYSRFGYLDERLSAVEHIRGTQHGAAVTYTCAACITKSASQKFLTQAMTPAVREHMIGPVTSRYEQLRTAMSSYEWFPGANVCSSVTF